jgi:ATP-dependent DNA ligase
MAEIFKLCSVESEKDFLDDSDEDYHTANIKFDGERIMAKCENGEIILINRNKKSCNLHFPEIVEELKKLKGDWIFDGEIISKNDDFDLLQKRALTKDKEKIKELVKEVPITYMIFDILRNDGENIKGNGLKNRMEYIKSFEDVIIKNSINGDLIKVAEFSSPKLMYEKAKKENREGIIIKHTSYHYSEGRLSDWKKVKFFCEGELEAISYEENPKGIRVEDKDGNSCQINNSEWRDVKDLINQNGKVIILIQFLEKTKDNKYRFPSYRGMKKEILNDGVLV